jgi:amidohydrolase
LGFQETRTAQLAAKTLEELGIRVQTGVAKTGVVGRLGQGHPVVGLRADMDALALQEANDVPYASQVPGVMHACGHDAHVAILLGAARLLTEMPDRPAGEIRFLFQPCEENVDIDGKSGAVRMVEEGALDGMDSVIGLHVTSDQPSGVFEIIDGCPTSAVSIYDAEVIGHGCHDAYPQTGLDAVFLLGQVINAVHGVKATRINPFRPSILSISTVHGGEARNVLPASIQISGTIRAYDEETHILLVKELERALGVAKALGGDYRLQVHRQFFSTQNDPGIVKVLRQVVTDLFGTKALAEPQPGMAGEDFAHMTRLVPGVWFQFGARIDDEIRPHHSPFFDVDESVFPMGAALLAETACRLLEQASGSLSEI